MRRCTVNETTAFHISVDVGCGIVTIKLGNVQAMLIGWSTRVLNTSSVEYRLIVDAKLGLPLLILSEVCNDLIRIPPIRMSALHY